ncbi:hypothetical protein SAY87_019467 [Trapa incisa]|uniref:DUF7806 domain-containing protein n=1 Tax=Trapa incisa TaxID=236973 RepID=A0AAN7K4L9_9MYRT|nr:hypothetical protein SAY87_019467 [Trapa incisa]
MEPLYAKLYEKYAKLKAKRFGELEQSQKDQEEKFTNYMAAAEELIEHLRDENDGLRTKLNELISSTRQGPKIISESLGFFLYKQLTDEVEKLRGLQNKGVLSTVQNDGGVRAHPNNLVAAQNGSDMSNGPETRSRKRKRRMLFDINAGSDLSVPDNSIQEIVQEDSNNIFCKQNTIADDAQYSKQPSCCKRPIEDLEDKSTCKCLFQVLIQHTLGLQFSVVSELAEVCISALHESSGYCFSLTWANENKLGELELRYAVKSLGTYERVAPDWMREAIKFSASMCPVFFSRLTRFIDVHH